MLASSKALPSELLHQGARPRLRSFLPHQGRFSVKRVGLFGRRVRALSPRTTCHTKAQQEAEDTHGTEGAPGSRNTWAPRGGTPRDRIGSRAEIRVSQLMMSPTNMVWWNNFRFMVESCVERFLLDGACMSSQSSQTTERKQKMRTTPMCSNVLFFKMFLGAWSLVMGAPSQSRPVKSPPFHENPCRPASGTWSLHQSINEEGTWQVESVFSEVGQKPGLHWSDLPLIKIVTPAQKRGS